MPVLAALEILAFAALLPLLAAALGRRLLEETLADFSGARPPQPAAR